MANFAVSVSVRCDKVLMHIMTWYFTLVLCIVGDMAFDSSPAMSFLRELIQSNFDLIESTERKLERWVLGT